MSTTELSSIWLSTAHINLTICKYLFSRIRALFVKFGGKKWKLAFCSHKSALNIIFVYQILRVIKHGKRKVWRKGVSKSIMGCATHFSYAAGHSPVYFLFNVWWATTEQTLNILFFPHFCVIWVFGNLRYYKPQLPRIIRTELYL